MVVRLAKRTTAAGRARQAGRGRAKPVAVKQKQTGSRKPTQTQKKSQSPSGSVAETSAPKPARSPNNGRRAAPKVRLGMTPAEVRECAGQPECILFGPEDHVEWQFGRPGVDVAGAPCLYVTTLTFQTGRVIRVTEKFAELVG